MNNTTLTSETYSDTGVYGPPPIKINTTQKVMNIGLWILIFILGSIALVNKKISKITKIIIITIILIIGLAVSFIVTSLLNFNN